MINLVDTEVERGHRNTPHIADRVNVGIPLMKTNCSKNREMTFW